MSFTKAIRQVLTKAQAIQLAVLLDRIDCFSEDALSVINSASQEGCEVDIAVVDAASLSKLSESRFGCNQFTLEANPEEHRPCVNVILSDGMPEMVEVVGFSSPVDVRIFNECHIEDVEYKDDGDLADLVYATGHVVKNVEILTPEICHIASVNDAVKYGNSASIVSTHSTQALTEDELTTFMLKRIEEGELHPEDIPNRLARFGLMKPEAFVAEMRERMQQVD